MNPQPPMSRRLLICVFLWSIVTMPPRSPAAPVTLYETTFENFNTSLVLIGQNQWIGTGSGGNGVANLFVDYGKSAYVGFSPATTSNGLFVWRPVNHNPSNLAIVTASLDLGVIDSSDENKRDEFRWSVYNIAGDQLFSVIFDNYDLGIYHQLDNGQFKTNGWFFENELIYALQIRMNFASNCWDAWLGDVQIITNEFITTTNASRTFGDVDAVWLRGGAVAGDNYMVFDNFKVTAEPIAPVIQPPQAVGGGPYRIRVYGAESLKFAIEASTNLTSWTSLNTNTTSGGFFDFQDNTAAGKPRRFYRARWVP